MNLSPVTFAILAFGVALSPMVVGAVTRNTTPTGKSDRVQVAQLEREKPANKKLAATPIASTPAKDADGRDPADFPRPAGLVRTSFSEAKGKLRDEEIANYHSNAGFDETVALYLERVPAAGWKKLSDSVSGSGANRLRMIEWEKPAKAVEIRFYTNKTGGSDLRVRIFTYKTSRATKQAASGPGAPAKDTPVVKAAPAAQANAVKTDGSAEKFGGAPVGPPPTNFQVKSYNPYSHNLSWSCDAGATCDIFRVDSTGRTQVADKIQVRGMLDHAYLEPNTVYRVVVHYRDGREGSLDYTYANPPQPAVVTGLRAEQTGPGKVKLTWNRGQPAVGNTVVAETYQVTSPTYAAADQRLGVNSLEITGMPVGNHWARVAMVYGDSSKMAPAPKEASVNFDVLTDRGRYRVTILGLECVHETADDPLQIDGKRDEVYAGVYWATVPRQSGPPVSGPIIETKVMGDTSGHPDRLQAGSDSVTGGIRTGDFIPSAAAKTAQPGVVANKDRFPLFVWEGELIDSGDALVVSPVVFEWDSSDQAAWNSWAGWWSAPRGIELLGKMARKSMSSGHFSAVLSEEYNLPPDPNLDGFVFTKYFAPGFSPNGNRPIGLWDEPDGRGALSVPSLIFVPHGLVLTRTKIEAALGSQTALVHPYGFADAKNVNNLSEMEGYYIAYIQIERLATVTPPPRPPPPQAGSTPPADTTPALKAPPAVKVTPAKSAEMAKNFGAAPVGPPPANLRVDSTDAVAHKVSWTADQWTSFDVFRIDSTGRTPVATNLTATNVTEQAYLEANTKYRVDVHHTDESIGSAEYTYASPPNPAAPTGFRAAQTGVAGQVKLSWVMTSYISGYQIYGPTLPPEGKFLNNPNTATAEVSGVPVGRQEFRVAVVYSSGGKLYPAPNQAKAIIDMRRTSDRYRVVCLGVRCAHETTDDMLQLDGKHDEIFAGAYVASVPRENVNSPRPTPIGIIRTKVMGDTNGFSDRLQTGSASPKGGIQTGDYVPDASVATAKPGVTGTSDRFPLALWEGELSDTGDIIVVAPVLFEWDKQDEGPWNGWTGWWSSPRGSADLGNLAHTTPSDGRWEIVLSSTWSVPINAYESYQRHFGPGFAESGGNRPVGVEDQANLVSGRGNGYMTPAPVYVPRGLCLTHARVEAALGAQSTTVIEWIARDDPQLGHAKWDGTYVLYIQIERLAPPPGN